MISVAAKDGAKMAEEMKAAGIDVACIGEMIEPGDKAIYVR